MDSSRFVHALDVERAEIITMADEVVQMLRHVHDAFGHLDPRTTDEVSHIGRHVHQREHGLIGRLSGRSASGSPPVSPIDEDVIFVPMHLERISENVDRLAAARAGMVHEGTLFTDRASREVGGLLLSAIEMLEGVRDAIRTGNLVLIRYVIEAGRSCEARANEYALFHEKRLVEGVCQPRASSVYLAMVDDLKGIEWHARQIAEKLQRMGMLADPRASERHGRVNGL
jgi:Na+/phosphate symporter